MTKVFLSPDIWCKEECLAKMCREKEILMPQGSAFERYQKTVTLN